MRPGPHQCRSKSQPNREALKHAQALCKHAACARVLARTLQSCDGGQEARGFRPSHRVQHPKKHNFQLINYTLLCALQFATALSFCLLLFHRGITSQVMELVGKPCSLVHVD